MNIVVSGPELALPWESTEAHDRRFQRILRLMLAAFVVFGLIVPWLPLEPATKPTAETQEPQFARIVLEEKTLPVVPPPAPIPEPVVQQEKKPDPKPIEPPPEPVERNPALEARELAAASGVMAFQDTLADMRDSFQPRQVKSNEFKQGQASAEQLERSYLASSSANTSTGIDSSTLSRDTGGPAISSHETVRVSSSGSGPAQAPPGQEVAPRTGRSDESIRRVMDSQKGGIFAIYHRALRKDPGLSGKLVFNMAISPSGEITELSLVSSDLSSDSLVSRILARIRMINFGQENATLTRVNYSLDFLPY